MTEITLKCTRGNATMKGIPGEWERPFILTGKRRKWDTLSWSLMDKGEVGLQGLYRGRYADAKCTVKELYQAFRQLGLVKSAADLKRACDANDIPVE